MGQLLQRCTPEEVSIPSKTMENLLDKLAQCETEPHGLMAVSYTHLDVYKRQAEN